VTMRGFDEDDLREVGEIIAGALGTGDLDDLRRRADALCERRPLYPGYRGYPEYRT
jgi:glycine/serine hydroxymethyltransferase